jgi:hypothetical protein
MKLGIEIRKTPDGRIQARRRDGKPLTPQDRQEARRIAIAQDLPPRAWVAEEVCEAGKLRAIKIYSELLHDHLYFIFDRSFFPADRIAVYFAEELPELRTKTPEQLREIHKVKLAFPGCRVIQEGAEARR